MSSVTSPLFIAVINQETDKVRTLLQQGADPNVLAPNNLTPLHQALQSKDLEIVKLLLSAGAKFDIPTDQGNTAIGNALFNPLYQHASPLDPTAYREFINEIQSIRNAILLAQRFSLDGKVKFHNQIFDLRSVGIDKTHESFMQSFQEFSQQQIKQIYDAIKQQFPGASLEEVNSIISKTLHALSKAYSSDVMEIKETMDQIQKNQVTSLLFISKHPSKISRNVDETHLEGIIFFPEDQVIRVNRGVGSSDRVGLEISHMDNPKDMQFFISRFIHSNSDIKLAVEENLVNQQLPTDLQFKRKHLVKMQEQRANNCIWVSEKALAYGTMYAVLQQYFKEKGLDEGASHRAALDAAKPWYKEFTVDDRIKMVKLILDAYPTKSITEMPTSIQDILLAIYKRSLSKPKYTPIVELLENIGLPKLYQFNMNLMKSVTDGDKKSVVYLCQLGANVNAIFYEDASTTPIYWPVFKNDVNMIKLLLRFGADLNLPCRAPWTPLDIALYIENIALYETLVSMGAKPTDEQRNQFRELSFDLAAFKQGKQGKQSWPGIPSETKLRQEYRMTDPNLVSQRQAKDSKHVVDLLTAIHDKGDTKRVAESTQQKGDAKSAAESTQQKGDDKRTAESTQQKVEIKRTNSLHQKGDPKETAETSHQKESPQVAEEHSPQSQKGDSKSTAEARHLQFFEEDPPDAKLPTPRRPTHPPKR